MNSASSQPFYGYFKAQLELATRICQISDLTFAEALARYTNLHRRFGWGVPTDPPKPAWRAYVETVTQAGTLDDMANATYAQYLRVESTDPQPLFGCFTYQSPDDEGIARIHFHVADTDDDTSPIAAHKQDRRRQDLAQLVDHLTSNFPDANVLQGTSWLYNTRSYCALFPPTYIASATPLEGRQRFSGTSSWGQLVNFRGELKPDAYAEFSLNVRELTQAADVWRVFPLRALRVSAPLSVFNEHFA